jgi:hypothetical protein
MNFHVQYMEISVISFFSHHEFMNLPIYSSVIYWELSIVLGSSRYYRLLITYLLENCNNEQFAFILKIGVILWLKGFKPEILEWMKS